MSSQYLIFIYFNRHNEKVTLECELAELRRKRNSEWEKTKHHLKLAKSKTSLLNIQESFDKDISSNVNGNRESEREKDESPDEDNISIQHRSFV